MAFTDGESRRWNDLELSPDATRDTGGPGDRPAGPEPEDLDVRPEPGDRDPEDGPAGRGGGPSDGPGDGPDDDPGDGPDGGPADDGEPDGPWRRTGPDSEDVPPDAGEPPEAPDLSDDEPRPSEDADASPETDEPDPAPEPVDATETEVTEQADAPADAPAEAGTVADSARPGTPALLGPAGGGGPHGLRDAPNGPGLPERPGVPDLAAGPVPDVPRAPEPLDAPDAFPAEPPLAARPVPDAVRPVLDAEPGAPPADAPSDARTPPDRPADHRDTPPDDRTARRVREATEARETDEEPGADIALPAGDRPCVPEPPAYVNYGRDGIARKDAYIDAAKRGDEALRVGEPGAPYETGLVRGYADRLRERIGPAVRDEVDALAEESGAYGAEVDVADADAIGDRVRAATRADYQVGDVTDAVRARVTVADPADLPALLAATERHFGTGDRGRILEVRPTPTDIPVTVATTHDGHPYTYELRLTTRNIKAE